MSQPQSKPFTGQKGDTDPTWFVRSSRRMAAMQWVTYLTENYPRSAEGRDMCEVLKDMAETYMSHDVFPHEYGDGCNVRWKRWFVLKCRQMLEELPKSAAELEMAIEAMERPAPSRQHDGMALVVQGPRMPYNGVRSRAMTMARDNNPVNMNVNGGVHMTNAVRASIHTLKAANVNARMSNGTKSDNSVNAGTAVITAAIDKMNLGFLNNPVNENQLVNHRSASADINRPSIVNGNNTSMMARAARVNFGNNVSNGTGNMNSNENIATSKKRPVEDMDQGYTDHNAFHSSKRVAVMPANNVSTGMGNNLHNVSNVAANQVSNNLGNNDRNMPRGIPNNAANIMTRTYDIPNPFSNNTYGMPQGNNVNINTGNPNAINPRNDADFNNMANSPPMNLTSLPTARRLFTNATRSHHTTKSDVGSPVPTGFHVGLGSVSNQTRVAPTVAPTAQASSTVAASGRIAVQRQASAPAPAAVNPSADPGLALIVRRANTPRDAAGTGAGNAKSTSKGDENEDEDEGSDRSPRS